MHCAQDRSWANLIPFGEYAFRTNLLSAVCSAGAAGFWFLVVHQTLEPVLGRIGRSKR